MKKIGNKMRKICFILIFNLSFIFGFQAKAVVDKNNITIDSYYVLRVYNQGGKAIKPHSPPMQMSMFKFQVQRSNLTTLSG